MYWLRSCYYKLIRRLSDVEQIEHFTGSGLYDRQFIEVLRNLDDPTPFLRGIVAELGFKRKEIPYEQPKRRAGKTHNNFYRLFDAAMLSVHFLYEGRSAAGDVSLAGICAAVSFVDGIIYLVMKLLYWDRFAAGMAPLAHRRVLPGISTDLFHWPSGRIYHEHQHPASCTVLW